MTLCSTWEKSQPPYRLEQVSLHLSSTSSCHSFFLFCLPSCLASAISISSFCRREACTPKFCDLLHFGYPSTCVSDSTIWILSSCSYLLKWDRIYNRERNEIPRVTLVGPWVERGLCCVLRVSPFCILLGQKPTCRSLAAMSKLSTSVRGAV